MYSYEQVLRKIHRLFGAHVESHGERVDVTQKGRVGQKIKIRTQHRRVHGAGCTQGTSEAFALLFNKNANAAI